MTSWPIDTSRDPVPIRLFRSGFVEFFTHISPWAIVALWGPVSLFLLIYPMLSVTDQTFPWYIPLGVVFGLFLWTIAEYAIHRFIFHYHPNTPRLERIFFLFHGVHHAQPQVKTRLVMPFPVSIPMAIAFYGLFYLVMAVLVRVPLWVNPLMAGFVIGYLAYDLTHYATHHLPMRWGRYPQFLKRHHMLHHYKDDNTRFGVSSPIWDWVFGTMGVE